MTRRPRIIGGGSKVRQAFRLGAPAGPRLDRMLAREPRMPVSGARADTARIRDQTSR